MRKIIVFIFIVLPTLLPTHLQAQKFEGLAKTPPMGWNSWNYFGCNVSEKLIKETADAMVSSGMKGAGYEYINIDDCWHGDRDSLGFIQPDPERFPAGMKALADYVHSKGLKLGIYSDAGWTTCAGRPGSRGYEYQDALTYARWGIDYLKYDWCATDGLNAKGAYTTMRNALYAAGRPIVFSICEWGQNKPWEWASEVGHLWRTTGDIYHCFDCVVDHSSWQQFGVMQVLEVRDNNELRKYSGPGHWNDPDMMEIGNGMTLGEDRTHFSLWCMLAAPLIAGNDIRKMSDGVRDILTNKEAIAINQDPLGIQGFKQLVQENIEVWYKPLKDGNWAICFINTDLDEDEIEYDWSHWIIKDDLKGLTIDYKNQEFDIRNIWEHKDEGTTKKTYKAAIGPHDVIMLKLIKNGY